MGKEGAAREEKDGNASYVRMNWRTLTVTEFKASNISLTFKEKHLTSRQGA